MKVVPLIATFLPLILALVILLRLPVEPIYIEVPVPVPVVTETEPVRTREVIRSPEFRQPPLKQWRPKQ